MAKEPEKLDYPEAPGASRRRFYTDDEYWRVHKKPWRAIFGVVRLAVHTLLNLPRFVLEIVVDIFRKDRRPAFDHLDRIATGLEIYKEVWHYEPERVSKFSWSACFGTIVKILILSAIIWTGKYLYFTEVECPPAPTDQTALIKAVVDDAHWIRDCTMLHLWEAEPTEE
jgi:hypothetical protein